MKKTTAFILRALLLFLILLGGAIFTRHLVDFPVYHIAGRSLLNGSSDLYSPHFPMGELMDYRYPPFFLVAFIPLWKLSYPTAAYLWYLLGILEIWACVMVLGKTLRPNTSTYGTSSPKWRRWAWVLAFLSVGQYFVMILHYGNAHLLAISLLFGSLYFAIRGKNGRAAFLMSLSITVKLTPLLILPYFALRKKWKFLLLVSFLTFAINLSPSFYFGFGKNFQLLKTWYGHVVSNQEFHETNGPINLSLKGELRRYLTQVDYSKRLNGDTNYRAVNFAAMPSQSVDSVWKVLGTVFLISGMGLVFWSARRKSNAQRGTSLSPVAANGLEAIELGIMICLMLFLGPLTSKIYFIALLWPVACLGYFAAGNFAASTRVSRQVLTSIAAVNLVFPLLPGRLIQRLFLVVGVDFYINLILLAALAYVLISERRSASIAI